MNFNIDSFKNRKSSWILGNFKFVIFKFSVYGSISNSATAVSFCFVQPRECPLSLRGFRGVGMCICCKSPEGRTSLVIPTGWNDDAFYRNTAVLHIQYPKNGNRKQLISNPHSRDTKSSTRASIFSNYQLEMGPIS